MSNGGKEPPSPSQSLATKQNETKKYEKSIYPSSLLLLAGTIWNNWRNYCMYVIQWFMERGLSSARVFHCMRVIQNEFIYFCFSFILFSCFEHFYQTITICVVWVHCIQETELVILVWCDWWRSKTSGHKNTIPIWTIRTDFSGR